MTRVLATGAQSADGGIPGVIGGFIALLLIGVFLLFFWKVWLPEQRRRGARSSRGFLIVMTVIWSGLATLLIVAMATGNVS